MLLGIQTSQVLVCSIFAHDLNQRNVSCISSFVSVENQHSDAVCIDQLKFYGTPKHAIEQTPFGYCHLPSLTWAENHKVMKWAQNSSHQILGRVQSRFEFNFWHSAQD